MGFVILMWLVVATFCFVQGIHILQSGQTDLLFLKSRHRTVGTLTKLAYAFVYFFCSAWLAAILATGLKRTGLTPARLWFDRNSGMLVWLFLLGVIGVLSSVQPAKMARWTLRAQPELADNRSVLIIWRVVGLLMLAGALFVLAKLP